MVRRLAAICSVGAAVEFCWAASEAVLVPYLGRQGVGEAVQSLVFLSNPALGLYVQPRMGAWSDALGKRTPFITVLAFVGIAGYGILLAATPVTARLGLSSTAAVVAIFIGFGASDMAMDCLLIPGRALVDDLTLPAKRGGANALFTMFQLIGRLAALVLGAMAWTNSGMGLYTGVNKHFNAMISLCVAVVFVSCGSAVYAAGAEDRKEARDSSSGDGGDGADTHEVEQLIREDGRNGEGGEDEKREEGGGHGLGSRNIEADEITKSLANSEDLPPPSLQSAGQGEKLLCVVQALGWVGICSQSFFWTAWRGERAGCADLAAQAVVGVATTTLLPKVNTRYGAAAVWCSSELLFHALMVATYACHGDGVASAGSNNLEDAGSVAGSLRSRNSDVGRSVGSEDGAGSIAIDGAFFVAALTGMNYAVHATNALEVAAAISVDPLKRAGTIAMVNNALPAGQLVVALLGGQLAQRFGGFQMVFVCLGVVGFVSTGIAFAVVFQQGLFRPRLRVP